MGPTSNEPGLDLKFRQVTPNRFGDGLQATFTSNKDLYSALSISQFCTSLTPIGVIDRHHPLNPLGISTGVEEEVMRSHVTRKHGPESPPKVCATADLVHRPRFPAMRKPILGPETFTGLAVGFIHTRASKRETSRSQRKPSSISPTLLTARKSYCRYCKERPPPKADPIWSREQSAARSGAWAGACCWC